jgi:hypothetical protein
MVAPAPRAKAGSAQISMGAIGATPRLKLS